MNEEQILKKRKAAEYKKLMATVPNELENDEFDTIQKIFQNYKINLNAQIIPENFQYHKEYFNEKLIFEKSSEDYLCLELPREAVLYFNQMRFRHIIELTNIQFYNIINFIKNLPEIDFFQTENQVQIIRSCIVEVYLVNLAQFYDETRDVITIGNSSYPLSSMLEIGVSEEGLENFKSILQALDKMQLTERESSLVSSFMNC
ncbi:unnamed protein product [Oikopleura dioica]|uniref:NR LBD domain-containing protein n=1 Tax=Oikopleura dioica TaxID=34765 RepID=E4YUG8_OIKDI|nr:unnamed protein product [Oikopleura dioica]